MIELQFSAAADLWAEKVCRERLTSVKLISLKALGDSKSTQAIAHFIDVSSRAESAEALITELKGCSNLIESDLARVGTKRVIGSVTTTGCAVCKGLVELRTGAFIGGGDTDDRCKMIYKLFLGETGLPLFLQRLHKDGVNYKILDISSLSKSRGLTPRQSKVLKSAFELGYYDYPKRINTDRLASEVGIKAGTITEILRRAERNVISRYFENEE
jgi:hypothetical protein